MISNSGPSEGALCVDLGKDVRKRELRHGYNHADSESKKTKSGRCARPSQCVFIERESAGRHIRMVVLPTAHAGGATRTEKDQRSPRGNNRR